MSGSPANSERWIEVICRPYINMYTDVYPFIHPSLAGSLDVSRTS